ncbi:Prophage integrase IntA [compost metagenome]
MSKLTPKFVKEVTAPGSYQDGRGLFLRVGTNGKKAWIFRYSFGTRHDLSVGAYPTLSLREARLEADKHRLDIAKGIDPLAKRAEARGAARKAKTREANTFKAEALRYIKTHAPSWSAKHRQQWENSLIKHVFPVTGSFDVREIDTDDVLEVLEPIWLTIPVTASRVRNRIELVLDAARARALRDGENPARWRGHLDKLLPKHTRGVTHFTSLLPKTTAALTVRLDSLEGPAARATELLILSVVRPNEICGARWDEFDWKDKIWVIPASRMKGRKEHRVPLTDAMIGCLDQLRGQHHEWVFLNKWRTGPIPSNAIGRVLSNLEVKAVPHGFRSTFRTWAAESTHYPREVCEMALAHALGSKVEAAYNRGDLLEKRRALMSEWAEFLATHAPKPTGLEVESDAA